MKKIAIFVEGLTEQIFIEKLLIEVFGSKKIAIQTGKISGSVENSKITTISTPKDLEGKQFYVLLYDCGGESTVKSFILEQRASLIKSNYSKIIGVLDIYPNIMRKDIEKYRKVLMYYTPTKDIEIKFVLSVMEIESWFLSEHTHFERIDANLKLDKIISSLGFDPSKDNMEEREEPANDLSKCYALVGKAYHKRSKHINRTVDALDYGNLYFEKQKTVSSLAELIKEIEAIFC